MTPLRQRMINDMTVRGLAHSTMASYLRSVTRLARHYRRSPDRISAPEVQDYLLFLHQQHGLNWSTCNTIRHSMRFFYRITLGLPDPHFFVPGAKVPSALPQVLNHKELVRLFTVTTNLRHRAVLMTAYAAGLSARLVESARHMAQWPMRAITGATNGARAVVKGHYRLIDQPAEGAVTVEHILAPHRARTLQRMRSQPTVLCVQDGTSLNFTRRGQTQGLGVIGSNQTGAVARGLHLHTTLAVTAEGVSLGVLRAGFDAPAPPDPDAKGPRPREEKKSFRWVEGLRDCAHAAHSLPETRVVCTTDREADFLDLFIERREHAPQVELLVRAKVNRVLGNDTTAEGDKVVRRLFDEVRNTPARGTCTVEVGRLSARVKASKQAPKAKRAARVADTTLRYQPVALPAVSRGGAGGAVGGACARGAPAPRYRGAGVVRAHHAARDERRRGPTGPAMVRPALAYRGLLPHPQVRLQGRGVAAPQRRAPRTGHRHQDGRGLAHPVDGAPRTRGP